MKLKIFVKPHEKIEDPNVELVSRGLPRTPVNFGYNRDSEMSVEPLEVQAVVVFEMKMQQLASDQIAFLDHLRDNEGAVVSYEVLNDDGASIERG